MKPRRSGRGRIIPARAGFTTIAAWGDDARADHPRSRGVYGAGTPTLIVAVGIIPARAGFTVAEDRREDLGGDHPRSRGVYGPLQVTYPGYFGSSPLARGLRTGAPDPYRCSGIIPARAGFTPTSAAAIYFRRDHPRSRGVYSITNIDENLAVGSSPLARGLLVCGALYYAYGRIIPARAGFTSMRTRVVGTMWDHPRSRGVYMRFTWRVCRRTGSSPLARGLPAPLGGHQRQPGIIPARAGFTESR